MPRELKNAVITHVSYVDKGANKKKFFLTKSEEKPDFEKTVKIVTKKNDEQKLVYGVVYEPGVEDSHGDFMTASEIEKAAHHFLKEARNIDSQHDFEAGAGEVVESYVAPADITVGETTIAKGSWILVTKATDEIWESIQKGEITGYSMAGVAEVEEAEEVTKEMKSFFHKMKDFFMGEEEPVTKGELKDRFNETRKRRNIFDAISMFEDFIWDELYSNDGPDPNKLRDYASELSDILYQVANSVDIVKELKKDEGESEVNKELILEVMKEALAPINERLDAIEKADATPEVTPEPEKEDVAKAEEVKVEDMVKAFKEVLKEELAPIADRLEVVEKARGISKADENVVVKKEIDPETESIFKSLIARN